jgi:hypothetical protein
VNAVSRPSQRILLIAIAVVVALWLLANLAIALFVITDSAQWLASWVAPERHISEGPLLEPCPTEDSTDCYWDADTMGNGRGNDLVTVAP